MATALVAPGAGVALVAWLGSTGVDQAREVSWAAFSLNNANGALTYGVPSLALTFIPSFGLYDIPIRTAILTVTDAPLTIR